MARTTLTWALIIGTLAVTFLIVWTHLNVSSEAEPPVRKETISVPARVVPTGALKAYLRAEKTSGVSWQFLASLGEAESSHGQSPLPGVTSGINSAGCCAGPMQLCITDACGNVASLYARDGDKDGQFSVYDIDDAAATAAAYIKWMEGVVGTNKKLLAAAYNAGPTIVSQEGIPPYPETRQYVAKVQKAENRIRRAVR